MDAFRNSTFGGDKDGGNFLGDGDQPAQMTLDANLFIATAGHGLTLRLQDVTSIGLYRRHRQPSTTNDLQFDSSKFEAAIFKTRRGDWMMTTIFVTSINGDEPVRGRDFYSAIQAENSQIGCTRATSATRRTSSLRSRSG